MRTFDFGMTVVAVSVLCACGGDGESLELEQPSPADLGSETDLSSETDLGSEADPAATDGTVATQQAAADAQSGDAWELEVGAARQALGGSCGSRSNIFNEIVNRVAVPDHFPPDSALAQLSAVAIGVPLGGLAACVAFGVANLSPTCDAHDLCYATRGASKSACDRAARSGWERACRATYDNIDTGDVALGVLTGGLSSGVALAEQSCRTACLAMAGTMFGAISAGGQSAFTAAQKIAAIPTADELPKGPIFF